MRRTCIGLFSLLLLLPLLGNAQLTNPSILTNELDQTLIDADTRKIVILVHGWNRNNDADQFQSDEFYYLQSILKLRLQNSDWKLVLYHWEKDAATGDIIEGNLEFGPTNAKQAAEHAFQHGIHLAETLTNKAPDLRLAHFIAHSAGSWAAREAAARLLQQNPYVVVQITLLDPFIPNAVNGITSPLSTEAMSQLSNVIGNDRISLMENYYAIDLNTDEIGSVGGRATSQVFSWGVQGLNLQVDQGIIYNTHSGPIEFYADTVAGSISPFQVPVELALARYFSTQIGWWRSLAQNEAFLPKILTHPKTDSVPSGTMVPLSVVAYRATRWQWFRNGEELAGKVAASISVPATPENLGKYVVRVSNQYGDTFSEAAEVSLIATSTKPQIAVVTPRTLPGIPVPQTQRITITGSGFLPSSQLEFSDGVTTYPPKTPTFISDRELKYDIAAGPNAATWTVKVVNDVPSFPFTFHVTASPDTTAPSAPIGLRATSSDWSRNNQVQVDWTNPSDPSGIAKAWVKIGSPPASATDGGAYSLPANKPLLANIPVTSGTRTIYVWLEDGAGNRDPVNRASLTLGVDSVPPVVRVLSPAVNPLTTTQNTVTLTGDYSDDLSGVVSVRWGLGSAGSGDATLTGTAQSGTWSTAPINLQPGQNIIAVTATDEAGNVGFCLLQVNRVTVANSGSVTVNITPSEAIAQGAKWRVNGGQWRDSGFTEPNIPAGPSFVEFINIPGGFRTPAGFSVNVTAGQNVSVSGNYTPVFVNDPPNTPGNPSPMNGANNLSRVNPAFSWIGGDPDSPVQYAFFLSTDSNPNIDNTVEDMPYGEVSGSSVQFTRLLLPATTYYWKVKARDDVTGVVVEGPVWRFTTEYAVPDLAVESVELDGNVVPSGEVQLKAVVKNRGSFTAPVRSLYFYLSRQPGAKEIRLNLPNSVWLTPPMTPGEERTITHTVSLNGLQAGQSFIDAWVEDDGATGDSLENNLQTIPINYIDGKNPEVTSAWLQNSFVKTGVANAIGYRAVDDVGIKSMDFYYSADGGLNWNPIQEGYVPPVPPTHGVSYFWVVPPNLPVGSNLTVRVVARDASGNWGERVAGPYTVKDGTAPIITVVSPNGGEVWTMGSQQQIRWNVSAPNGVAGITIYLLASNLVSYVAGIASPTSTTYNWTLPNFFATSTGRIWVKIVDSNGNEAEDTSDSFFTIRDNSVPPPAPWTEPQQVTADANGDSGGGPKIATDAAGNVHMVYLSTSDTGFNPRTITQTILYKKRVGGTWSAAQTVYSVTQQTDSQLTGYFSLDAFRIAVSGSGAPHITWIKGFGAGGITDRNQNDIYYTTLNGTAWATPFNLSAALPGMEGIATQSGWQDMAVDSLGAVHIVWRDGTYWNPDFSSAGTASLYHRKRTAGGEWSAIEKITTEYATQPVLAVDRNDGLHCAFLGYAGGVNRVLYMRRSGLAWTTPVVALSPVDSYTPVIATDGTNGVHVLGAKFDSETSKTAVRYAHGDGVSWSVPDFVYQTSSLHASVLKVDSLNRPHVVLEDRQFPASVRYLTRNGSAWSAPTKLNYDSQIVINFSTDADLAANDELHVVWANSVNNIGEIFYNHANVGSATDVYAPDVVVNTPAVGEILPIGTLTVVRWIAADNTGITSVGLDYSTNNGAQWNPISSNEANDGAYSWVVPSFGASAGQVRVTAYDATGNVGYGYSGTFATIDSSPPAIAINAPTNGTTLVGGSALNVTWTATDNVGVTRIDLEYSLNNGAAWADLATNLSNSGTQLWTVPAVPTATLLFRATARDAAGQVSGYTTQPMSIVRANTPPLTPHSPFPLLSGTGVPFLSPLFQWRSTDLDGDALTYHIRLGTNTNTWVTLTLNQAGFAPGLLRPSTTYFWQAFVTDGQATNASPIWTFTTETGPIPPITLPSFARTADGRFHLGINNVIFGENYSVQGSTNLVEWLTLTNFTTINSVIEFLDSTATNFNRRFYRVTSP